MIKAVIFDLDGTLVPLKDDEFVKMYFSLLCKKLVPLGYDKDILVKTMLTGNKMMKLNDGRASNDVVFWNEFAKVFGDEKRADERYFHDFYLNEFNNIKSILGEKLDSKKVIDFCKSKGLKTIIATSPVLPIEAMVARIGFVDLKEDDFDYISHYSNSNYAKPNPKFIEEVLEKNNLKPEEVLYFGNSEKEDGQPAKMLGIKVFIVGDYIIEDDENLGEFEHFKFDDIIDIISNIRT